MARLRHFLASIASLAVVATDLHAAGALVPRDGSAPIGIRSHRVLACIEDGIARTQVRQVFVNPHPRALEAVYSFPLPEDAAIVELSMTVAGTRLEGLLAERREARRVYDSMVREAKDPALLEQIGRSEYRLSVFPVAPNVETVIELTYIEPTPSIGGEIRYVYPLASQGTASSTEQDLTATIEFKNSAPIVALESPVAGMATSLLSAREARASFEKIAARLDSDLVVVAKVATAEPSFRVHTYRAPSGDAYFSAILTAPMIGNDESIPRDFTFVIDASGSMRGEKLERAKSSASWWVERLGPRDRANVVFFSDSVRAFADAPVDATPDQRRALLEFIAAAKASGGTDLHSAVHAAGSHRAETSRLTVSVVLTDGRPTVGETSSLAILKCASDAGAAGVSIHTFGIGEDVDPVLLDGIASATNSGSEVLRVVGDIEERLRVFLNRIGAPAIRGASIRVGDREVSETWPKAPFTVYRGEQLVVTGRCAEFGVLPVSFQGVFDGAPLPLRAIADFGNAEQQVASGSIVARDLYAKFRLAALERAHRLRLGLDDASYHAAVDGGRYDTSDELVAAMIDVSLETGVQCAYTSFLALLPEDRARLNPRDQDALDAALKRVAERRRILARSEDESVPDPDSDAVAVSVDAVEIFADSEFAGVIDNVVIGVGGGAGGRFGGKYGKRSGGKGGGWAAQKAVDTRADWLSRHQEAQGFWSAAHFEDRCEKERCSGAGDPALDVRVTCWALLAYLGAGNTPKTGKYKATLQKGLNWLLDRQDPTTGLFLPESTHEDSLVDQALATLVLTEAYGLAKLPNLKDPAERAIAALLARRVSGEGWRRAGVESGDCDLATTTYALFALLSAQEFGVSSDPTAIAEVHDWLKSRPTDSDPTDAARILFARLLLGDAPDDPALRAMADVVHAAIEARRTTKTPIESEFCYLASYAMYQLGGSDWDRMQEPLLEIVVKAQQRDGDEWGSWNPAPPRIGSRDGGRVEATALSTLVLEAYYRYDRILGAREP